MVEVGDLPRLGRELVHGERLARRQAAADLLALSRKGYDVGTSAKQPLSLALDDPDEAVRVAAARALLDSSTIDALRRCVAALDAAPPSAAYAQALVAAARAVLEVDTAGALAVLAPLFWAGAGPGELFDVNAMMVLSAALRSGVDVSDQMARVGLTLQVGGAAQWHAAHVLSMAAAVGLDVGSAREALVAVLESEDEAVAAFAAGALAHVALRTGDVEAAVAYLGDSRWPVREGAATACREAAQRGVDVTALIEPLGKALADASGGVVYQALRALQAAVEAGRELGPAVPALKRAVKKLAYKSGPDQWAFGLQATLDATHTHDEQPRSGAASILAWQYASQGDWGKVEAMLHGSSYERAGAGSAMLGLKERGVTPEQRQRQRSWRRLGSGWGSRGGAGGRSLGRWESFWVG